MTALEVADWRRRVFAMYAAVRESTDMVAAHDLWRRERDELFARHPSTPLLPEDLAGFTGLPVAPYDPAWRFEVALAPGDERRMEVETGTDGIVPFDLIGRRRACPSVGRLDVWRLASYGGGIFIPVKDASAGARGGTYGGGRYLLDTVKGADLGAGEQPGFSRARLQLRVQPVVRLRPRCGRARWRSPATPWSVEIPVGERYFGSH